jgi:catechol 2,3-dioxygenase-like lactoylglutathione lyase family enzyme
MNDTNHFPNLICADHTGFTVQSLEASLNFWVNVLGFKHLYTNTYEAGVFLDNVVGVEGASLTLAMIEAPGGHLIELLEYHSPDDIQVFKPRSCDVGAAHLAFTVKNIDGLLAKIESVGGQRLGELQTVADGERKGLRLGYVRAPDGLTLEFLEWPDAPSA